MAKTPEAKVKALVVQVLKKHNVYYFFPATGGFGRSGVPDIVGCVNGVFLAIECKAAPNTPTALQWKEISNIRAVGGAVLVINEHTFPVLEPLLEALKIYDSSEEKGGVFAKPDQTES